MSNKLKREVKKVMKKQEELTQKEQEELYKKAFEIHHSKYLPETEVPFNGQDFMTMMDAMEECIRNLTFSTYDENGRRAGFGVPDSITKISEFLGSMQVKHRENFEKGIAIPHPEYIDEMNKRAKVKSEDAALKVVPPVVEEEPATEKVEEVEAPTQEKESKIIDLSTTDK